MLRSRHSAPVFALLLLLAGCANSPPADELSDQAYDPWERLNRGLYGFNVAVDNATTKPLAKGYKAVMPTFARRGVSNFFDNLTTPRSALNNFLQGKPLRGFKEMGRFVVNSTVGIGGLISVTDIEGWSRYDEDFSQTFAVWGLPEGPFVMLPLFGPHTVLDTMSLPFDYYSSLQAYLRPKSARNALTVLSLLDSRQRLLSAEKLLDDSKDPYITFRESYRQNREYEIYDGDPPIEDDYYEFMDDEFFDEEPEDESGGSK